MKFHVTLKGKPTSISVDDVLVDYLGAWVVRNFPKYHSQAKFQYNEAKDFIKVLCDDPALPNKNVSQFIQAKIIRRISEPHLAPIIETRGPRYVPPKRERYAIEPDPQKADELMAQLMAGMKNSRLK
ncbi:MAG: hypothetical protein FD135_3607 [Comamonadaceae bacterium]|nr:MAG: hypothetical protein FD135_3607 [Comamonadaceae bacterium]